MFDITATIVFHREGAYALPALASLRDMVESAKAHGLNVEAQAVLDNADSLTREIVSSRGAWLDAVREVSFGDLGHARNAGVAAASGEYLAFLDGDDLWGADWLRRAHASAITSEAPKDTIWHPEMLYYFYASDFDRHSMSAVPNGAANSFHFFHYSSDHPEFDSNALFIDNVWSANVFASRDLHLRYPYRAIERKTDGRLLMGGRGPFREPRHAADWAHLERAAQLMFPQLSGTEYEFRWAGRIAITRNFLPHVHMPAKGMTIALGYNGRGIAMATTLGKHLAAYLGGAAKGLPLPPTLIEPVPLHALQRFYISAGVAWYALLDALS